MNWTKHFLAGLIALLTTSFALGEVPYLEAKQLRKIEPPTSVVFGFAGRSVSLDNGRSLIGAPGYRNTASKVGGGAFIHQEPIWSPESLLTSSAETGDDAGYSVSFSGNIAAVGAPINDDNGPDQGKVILFAYNPGRRAWLPFQELTAPLDYHHPIYFGWSVFLEGNRLVVGAPAGTNAFTHGNQLGAAYIFEPDDMGEWLPIKTFTGPETGDLFGYSVSLQGSRAIVGAPCANSDGNRPVRSGSAYVYDRGSRAAWTLDEKIDPSAPGAGDAFGFSVDLDGSHALVGAPNDNSGRGSVALFQKQIVAGWIHTGTFESDGPQNGDLFGLSVSIDGDILVVGSPNRQIDGVATGAVFPFWRDSGSWVRQAPFTSEDAANGDSFGAAVSLEGSQVLVGSPLDNEALNNSGAAFLFDLEEKDANKPPTGIALNANSVAENPPTGTVVGTLSTSDPNAGQTFTYELLTDAGGKFSLGGPSNNQILVNGALDFEVRPSHTVQVRTTDDCGLSFTQNVEITVIDVEIPATITLGNLTQIYTGSPLGISYTTLPAAVPVDIAYATFDGNAPTNTGQYLVTVTARGDSDYTGSVSGTLTVNKAAATISLGNLTQTYTGSGITPGVTTTPAGLATDLLFDGSSTLPVDAGSYSVGATINDPNYQGTQSGTLIISPAPATVTLGNLTHNFNGQAKSATATTVPPGLNVAFTYDGNSQLPSAIGSYAVNATITDGNYSGFANGTFSIKASSASIVFNNLIQTYDGTPKVPTVTTGPAGLAYTLTFDGSPTPPVNAGDYQVVATITEPNYPSSFTEGLFRIRKANQTITFPQPDDMLLLETQELHAVSSSGLPVTYGSFSATFDENRMTPFREGVISITASFFNENYTYSSQQRSINVGPKSNLILPSEPGNFFGDKMDLWQDRLAITQRDKDDSTLGKVFLFEKSLNGSWEETGFLPSAASSPVAIFDDLLTLSGVDGEAKLYQRDENASWNFVDSLPSGFVRSFSISNDIIYTANGNGAWANIRLSNGEWWVSEPMVPSGGEQIHQIDSWGETCVVACPGFPGPLSQTGGATYIFERDVSGEWTETKRIEHRSNTIALSANYLAIGNLHRSFDPPETENEIETLVYRRENGGWVLDATIIPEGEILNSSPSSLSLFDNYLLLGTSRATDSPSTVYPFIRNQSGEWVQQQALNGLNSSGFGSGTAVWSQEIIVGAPYYYLPPNNPLHGGACSFRTFAVNWLPSDIALSSDSVTEGLPVDTVVGRLTTTDSDAVDTFFKYELVSGVGDDDNDSFRIGEIRSDRLLTNTTFDFQEKSIYQIRLRSTDVRGGSVENSFIVSIVDEPDPATILISDLNQTYDGQLKQPTIRTNPPGLDFEIAYAGPNKPINAGTYPFTVEIAQAGYFGSTTSNLVIEKADQEIILGVPDTVVICEYIQAPAQNVRAVASSELPVTLISSDPSVLTVQFDSQRGWGVVPVSPGFVTISATQPGDSNYRPAASVVANVEVITRFTEMVLPGSVTELPGGGSIALDGNILMNGQSSFRRNAPGNWEYLRDLNPELSFFAAGESTFFGISDYQFQDNLEIWCDESNVSAGQSTEIEVGQDMPSSYFPPGWTNRRAPAAHGNLLLVGRPILDPNADPALQYEDIRGDVLVFAQQPDCEWALLSTSNLDRADGEALLNQIAEERRIFARNSFGRIISTDGETAMLTAGNHVVVAKVGLAGIEQLELLPDIRFSYISALVIEGDIAAVGYSHVEDFGYRRGIVDVYERDPGGIWNLAASLSPPDPDSTRLFGVDLDLSDGTLAIVGLGDTNLSGPANIQAPGAAYLFEKGTDGSWQKLFKVPVDAYHLHRIEIDKNTVAIASWNERKVTIFELDRPESQPFETIANGHFNGIPLNSPQRNLFADPDGDGQSTLLEIATGTDPFRPDQMAPGDGSLPLFSMEEGNLPVLNFTVPNPIPKVRYLVECSTSLQGPGDWHAIAPDSVRVAHKTAEHSTIQMRFAPLPEGQREFFRLRIEVPE